MDLEASPSLPPLDPPLFLMGAPRSGTTFLVELLNRHPRILVTNELRIMTYANRVLNRIPQNKWILMNGRDDFIEYFRPRLAEVVEGYYRHLGVRPGMRWGDKNPHYADAKTDPECLELIDRMFPAAQFVNLVRDGRQVVSSIVLKGWLEFDQALDVWVRHVRHADQFAARIGPGRMLTIRYEDLMADPATAIDATLDFLGLDRDPAVYAFAAEQAVRPTPFSRPTQPVRQMRRPRRRLSAEQEERILAEAAVELARYGYPTGTGERGARG